MIYFDNAATTMPSKKALEKAQEFNKEMFFNPSALYDGGLKCSKAIKTAKDVILNVLSTVKHEVVFTSCGTESDNLAIFGAVKRGVFVTDKGEHSAVYKSFLELKNRNIDIQFISLNRDGTVNTEELFDFCKHNKVDFVSIVHVNNETGGINDINNIAKQLKQINPKIIFHSDGVQAFCKIPYRLSENIDLYSISAHKINGLKGTGALLKKKGLNLSPIIFGGGQENGIRSGTENVFGIKVFENAVEEHFFDLTNNFNCVAEIKNYIKNNLDKEYFEIISGDNSSPFILSASVKGVRGEVFMHALESEGIIIGNGSACSSKNRFSRVIEACGYKESVLDGMIRISFSTYNTLEEGKIFVKKANETANRLVRILK